MQFVTWFSGVYSRIYRNFFDSGGPPGAISHRILIHAFSRFGRRLRSLFGFQVYICAYITIFSSPPVLGGPSGGPPGGPSGGDIPNTLIHAFSRFGRRLNAVRYMVFRRIFAHKSQFIGLRRPSGAPCGRLARL